MRLYVIENYKSAFENYEAGQVIQVNSEHAQFLMTDCPSCFSTEPPKAKAIEAPPKNKMIGAPDYHKLTVGQLKSILEGKGLPTSGKKADLIARLEDAR